MCFKEAAQLDMMALQHGMENEHVIRHVKIHSKRVEKMHNYTRNEWRRCTTTLETSGEDVKRNECKTVGQVWWSAAGSVVGQSLNLIFDYYFSKCFTSSPPVSSVVLNLPRFSSVVLLFFPFVHVSGEAVVGPNS